MKRPLALLALLAVAWLDQGWRIRLQAHQGARALRQLAADYRRLAAEIDHAQRTQ